eukprot:316864-Chlamydomonas_euryale.AAC.1
MDQATNCQWSSTPPPPHPLPARPGHVQAQADDGRSDGALLGHRRQRPHHDGARRPPGPREAVCSRKPQVREPVAH